jgi:hypothetical protein
MTPYNRFQCYLGSIGWFAFCLSALPCTIPLPSVVASDPAIRFDVPALMAAREVWGNGTHSLAVSQKTIEVVIPVSSEIRTSDHYQIDDFRFDIFWNRNAYPICDYSPKTQTFSEIAGTISIDKSTDDKKLLGLNLAGGYQEIVDGVVKAELGTQQTTKIHYQEIPQQEVLVAAGTTRRGTGAFFRFHPSRTETLEGGRDLVVAFQVPQSWRGGVLQVECVASGSRKNLAWSEPFQTSRAFMLPIYLDGDDQAREAATEFVRTEQQLRSGWMDFQTRSETNALVSFQNLFAVSGSRKPSLSGLPENWVHYLIQSSDGYLERYRKKLPSEITASATQFVEARTALLKLSR